MPDRTVSDFEPGLDEISDVGNAYAKRALFQASLWLCGAKITHLPRVFRNCKVQCAFPMVISSEFRMRQHWDGDHQKDAPHFTYVFLFSGVKRN